MNLKIINVRALSDKAGVNYQTANNAVKYRSGEYLKQDERAKLIKAAEGAVLELKKILK